MASSRDPVLPVRLLGTGSCLPGRLVPTEEVVARSMPGRSVASIVEKTGILSRYWHDPAVDTVASVSARALREALEDAGLEARALRRLVLTNSHGFDGAMPPTANKVLAALGVANTLDAFDLNNACAGFLTGLELGARCVLTGLSPIAVVATELASRVTTPEDPRPYLIMGDASGAALLGPSRGGSGIVGFHLGNDGFRGDRVTLEHGRARVCFAATGKTIGDDVIESMRLATQEALAMAGLELREVRWGLLHQANGVLFEQAREALGLERAQVLPLVRELGSVGAASVAVSLAKLRREGLLGPGDHVLLTAVGSGLGYGAVVYREAR